MYSQLGTTAGGDGKEVKLSQNGPINNPHVAREPLSKGWSSTDESIVERFWVGWKNMNPYFRCFVTLFLYFAVAITCYRLSEGWSYLDICYFVTITFTTVGYGDIAPETRAGKLCTIILIYLGLFLVGALIADLFESMFDAHQAVFLQELRGINDTTTVDSEGRDHGLRQILRRKGKREVRVGIIIIISLFLAIYIVGVGWSVFVGGLEWLNAFYFVTVTISTVGYGDENASKMHDDRDTKIWAIFFVVLSVFSFGAMITTGLNVWAGVIRRRKILAMIDEKMTQQDFNRFLELGDVNNDNRIDMAEFVFICLDELGLLSSEADVATLLAIQHEFKKADRSRSGFIDRCDIVEENEGRTKRLRGQLRNAMHKAKTASMLELQ